MFPKGLQLLLEYRACTLVVIKVADAESFRSRGFKSILHMTYHPNEERFYKQVAVQAHTKSKFFVNVRENPKMILPNDVTIVLIPEGGCITGWEEIVDPEPIKENLNRRVLPK